MNHNGGVQAANDDEFDRFLNDLTNIISDGRGHKGGKKGKDSKKSKSKSKPKKKKEDKTKDKKQKRIISRPIRKKNIK